MNLGEAELDWMHAEEARLLERFGEPLPREPRIEENSPLPAFAQYGK